ncbi:MAG: DEAD/DEAH box helicase [Promethearchaeota archaeon]
MNFTELGINEHNVNELKRNKIVKPTPVQQKAIPLILKGQNIMAQARTGSGKTLAFVLPIIESLKYTRNEAIILVPTRELATQIYEVIRDLGNSKVKALPIYGGVSINNQITQLEKGINIIVGTPGRIIDLYKRRNLWLNDIRFVVVDEADRMFDMGFTPDVKYILNQIHSDYQFMLFSATFDNGIRELVKKYSKNQFKFQYRDKFKTFLKILRREKATHLLVFVNTKKTATWLSNKLKHLNNFDYKVDLISGDLSQYQREKILKAFKDHRINLLIATDVAARGLDINNISHVFNYDIPKYPENYIHRIGRTSRMNKHGVAITLCVKDEYEYLCHIEGLIDKEIKLKTIYTPESNKYHNPFY